ncbi:MAG TPA: MBL fold metallo-hydrolase [Planctomycetota bacterium]|nr:MBL fold metallo-hydrolase [Planctomycetota bacterium]
MKRVLLGLMLLAFGCQSPGTPPPPPRPSAPGFRQPDPARHPEIFTWTDVCNVHVIRDRDSAVLIDLGDGSVLSHLAEIGVSKVEWVLFTHHHREACQGAARLRGTGIQVAAPDAEAALFENPSSFRRMNVKLGDPYTVHGASFVRPPTEPIRIDRKLRRMETFDWHGRELWCLDTRGNSPGSMSYFLKDRGRWLAFTGDLMCEGATMHTWFDTEWDYGFAAGIYALTNSAGLVQGFDPEWLLPSHGPPVPEPARPLAEYQEKLRRLERLYVRGYDVNTFSGATQDKLSRPTAVPHVWQVLPHLYKFRGPNFYPNLSMILAPSGRALLSDCGLLDEKFLDETIRLMKERMGLRSIDAVVISHMHGDHFLQAPHLRKTYGTQIWAIDKMGPMCEHPERFDYCASIQAYGQMFEGAPLQGVKFDRLFKPGESFEWEGYRFTIDWMPGQTEFALALWGMIDGKRVVFTGDNLFGDPDDPRHTGHEAVVARNSGILEEGYIYGAEYLSRLKPDLVMGGHSYVMPNPAAFIERYRQWSYAMRDAFRALSSEDDYRLWFDPFWVRAEPYRVKVKPGQAAEVAVHVRNFRPRPQAHRIEVHAPPGLTPEPPILEGELSAESRGSFPLLLRATPELAPGVRIVAFDTTLDGRRYGERFDLIVEVAP